MDYPSWPVEDGFEGLAFSQLKDEMVCHQRSGVPPPRESIPILLIWTCLGTHVCSTSIGGSTYVPKPYLQWRRVG